MKSVLISLLLILSFLNLTSAQKLHPNLVLTKNDASQIKKSLGKYSLFNISYDEAVKTVDKVLNRPIDVPVPKDGGGGYTHERHKANYNEMYLAGILYSVTGKEKYAIFIRDMLKKYAILYPTLGKHPKAKEESYGKLFWQSLNETVWLLHTIQAYDCVYDWLKPEERKLFETNIFNPMVNFFLTDCKEEFDRIHNHGTWIDAAVGMTGYVLGNEDYVKKALYGSKMDGSSGFIKQLDMLFSPDGFYTEGGYYARYALWPFFIFTEAINHNQPELKIYEYRNEILKKAFYCALQVTYTNGEFIPVNDALKEKTWLSPEIIYALGFVYQHYGHDKEIFSLAKQQGKVALTYAGLELAKDFSVAKSIPNFSWKSIQFTDGPDGKGGGVGIFRYGPVSDQQFLYYKYTSHGLSHGHFDKLSFAYYDQGKEIIQDYGSVRFLNIEQKDGGGYLKLNTTYAKQTVAHNTLVVDEQSDFQGKQSVSEKYHPQGFFFDVADPDFMFMSAKDDKAYSGVKMQRTFVMVADTILSKPVIFDIFKVNSDKRHQYDLPYYFMGQIINLGFDHQTNVNKLVPLGNSNGYEHLWKEAEGDGKDGISLTWWIGKRFYTITTNADDSTKAFITRIGANDPNFDLRPEQGFMLRRNDKDYVFASIIESHGEFNPIEEYTKSSYPTFQKISVVNNDNNNTLLHITGKRGIDWYLVICNSDPDKKSKHEIEIKNNKYNWTGPVGLFRM